MPCSSRSSAASPAEPTRSSGDTGDDIAYRNTYVYTYTFIGCVGHSAGHWTVVRPEGSGACVAEYRCDDEEKVVLRACVRESVFTPSSSLWAAASTTCLPWTLRTGRSRE
eukprot:scaffold1748_cov258-Pinguiococcus_pyrenoidosus.AAC.8